MPLMQKTKLIGAAAFSLALAGGGVAGAMFGSPLSSGAQEQTTTTNGDTGTTTSPDADTAVAARTTRTRRRTGTSTEDGGGTLAQRPIAAPGR